MEIFNVHLPELILIAGLALVLFGPERLPELGRLAGKQVAKFLAWQQQSPELQMITEMRNQFEREIAQLRDELALARNQLDLRNDAQTIIDELKTLGQQTQAALDEASQAGQTAVTALDEAKPAPKPVIRPPAQAPIPAAAPAPALPASASGVPQPITDEDRMLFGHPDTPVNGATSDADTVTPDALSPAEMNDLLARLTALTGELQAIVFQLQARGLLDANWQPVAKPAPAPPEETITP
ncbi:twin-arginine translocase TatA/TatE family subunit [Chloroflexus sp.]|uniref:twin-arginine translocase TatA/TatE family subunit n=1 Tax=Chloroflexus sp. TaxID=1904827 RepID=UPI00262D2273|nr:twin-arginine translocase TatA/TatE family subunit [uncultured Chloroflexus sp.]